MRHMSCPERGRGEAKRGPLQGCCTCGAFGCAFLSGKLIGVRGVSGLKAYLRHIPIIPIHGSSPCTVPPLRSVAHADAYPRKDELCLKVVYQVLPGSKWK